MVDHSRYVGHVALSELFEGVGNEDLLGLAAVVLLGWLEDFG